jgi:hypothetical protein
MSPELIDELAARILQFTLQLHDNGLGTDATVERGETGGLRRVAEAINAP